MNVRYKKLIKNTGILTISQFASKILVFLLVPLYTSVLSTSEYGIYDIVLTTIQLLFPIITMNVIDAIVRFSLGKENTKEDIASIGFKYIVRSILLVSVVLIVIYGTKMLPSIYGYEYLIGIYYSVYVINTFTIQFAKGIEKIADMGIAGVIGTFSVIISNILFLLVFKLGLKGFFIANIIGQLMPVVYLVIRAKIWRYIKIKSDRQLERLMIAYSTPLIINTLAWWINSASDKYIITFILGASANGLIAVAYKIPTILSTVQSIFNQAWQISAITEYVEDSSEKFYATVFNTLNTVMCAGASGLIMISYYLAKVLYAHDFFIAWKFVPFLIVASVINAASGILGPILDARKDSKAMALAGFVGATVNIILNFILIYLIGIQGATITTVISSFVPLAIRKIKIGDAFIITNYKKVLLSWVLLCIQSATLVYVNYSVFFQIPFFIVMIVVYNSELRNILRILLKRKKAN